MSLAHTGRGPRGGRHWLEWIARASARDRLFKGSSQYANSPEKGTPMTEHTLTHTAHGSQPLDHASEGASGIIPAVGGMAAQMIYTTSYAVAYGIVFPAMLIVRIVPKDNALVHGLADGAQAARARALGWEHGQNEESLQSHDDDAEDGAEHNGSATTSARRPYKRRQVARPQAAILALTIGHNLGSERAVRPPFVPAAVYRGLSRSFQPDALAFAPVEVVLPEPIEGFVDNREAVIPGLFSRAQLTVFFLDEFEPAPRLGAAAPTARHPLDLALCENDDIRVRARVLTKDVGAYRPARDLASSDYRWHHDSDDHEPQERRRISC